MKKVRMILALILSLLCLSSLIACGGGDDSSSDTKPPQSSQLPELPDLQLKDDGLYGVDCLVKLTANITDAKGMGIEERKTDKKSSSASGYALKNYEEEIGSTKPLLLKGDANNNVEEVVFKNQTGETITTSEGKEIKAGETISQGEFREQINKLYVDTYNDLTYTQYIPTESCGTMGYYSYNISSDLVRSEDKLTYMKNGLTKFDTEDYFTAGPVKSFVIDNKTGKIYPLTGVVIKEINDGLIKTTSGLVCDVKIVDGNLQIQALFENKDINVSDFFKDKYGNIFIKNEMIDEVVEDKNVVFFTYGYYKANNDEVVYFDLNENSEGNSLGEKLENTKLLKVKENLQTEAVVSTDNFVFDGARIDYDYYRFSHIENGYAYFYNNDDWGPTLIRMDVESKEGIGKSWAYNGGDAPLYEVLDYNTVIKYEKTSGEKVNAYYTVVDFDNPVEWTLLKENCVKTPYMSESKIKYPPQIEWTLSEDGFFDEMKEYIDNFYDALYEDPSFREVILKGDKLEMEYVTASAERKAEIEKEMESLMKEAEEFTKPIQEYEEELEKLKNEVQEESNKIQAEIDKVLESYEDYWWEEIDNGYTELTVDTLNGKQIYRLIIKEKGGIKSVELITLLDYEAETKTTYVLQPMN